MGLPEVSTTSRHLGIPIGLMFEMWTNPERMAQWLPLTGMLTKFVKGEIKQGGRTFLCMEGVNGTMYARAEYLRSPSRIVLSTPSSSATRISGRLATRWHPPGRKRC